MNGWRFGRLPRGQAGAPVLQQNAPGLVSGSLTGLEHRQSRLVEGHLQEVSGTERGILVSLSRLVRWQQAGETRRRERAYLSRRVSQAGQDQADTGAVGWVDASRSPLTRDGTSVMIT